MLCFNPSVRHVTRASISVLHNLIALLSNNDPKSIVNTTIIYGPNHITLPFYNVTIHVRDVICLRDRK